MQKNGARLPDYCEFIIDFTKVTDIDAGAAFGIVDGLQFVIEGNKTLKVKLVGINVSIFLGFPCRFLHSMSCDSYNL